MQARRIGSQHGLRIFSMICPSLPQEDYRRFSEEACQSIRVDRCEHVWAEPIRPRRVAGENSRGFEMQRPG